MIKEIVCQKCQKLFSCNVDDISRCWCNQLNLVEIDESIETCICKECLTKLTK